MPEIVHNNRNPRFPLPNHLPRRRKKLTDDQVTAILQLAIIVECYILAYLFLSA